MKIVVAVVVYNKEIAESTTCTQIRKWKCRTIEVLVIDNSTKENHNKEKCEEYDFRYISMCGNKGLSKAYNVAVNESAGADAIVFLDDDTEITKEYFEKLEEALKTKPDIDIFVPIVYGQDGVIYSPNEFHFLRNHFIKNPTQNINKKKFNAIASCLAVRMRVFDYYRFNEKLFVDQIDQFFFCEQRKFERKFDILPVMIHQNFYQRASNLNAEDGWKRLKIRLQDIMVHAQLMEKHRYIILGYIKCCGLGIQIGKKCRSIKIVVNAFMVATRLLFSVISPQIGLLKEYRR